VLIAAFQRPRQVVIKPSRVLIPALLTVQSVCRPSAAGPPRLPLGILTLFSVFSPSLQVLGFGFQAIFCSFSDDYFVIFKFSLAEI